MRNTLVPWNLSAPSWADAEPQPLSRDVLQDLIDGVAALQGLPEERRLTDWLRAHAESRDALVDAFRVGNRDAAREALMQIAVIAALAVEWMERNPERW